MNDLKCEVCGEPALGVCCSSLGAISCAFCEECLVLERQPYEVLLGGLSGLDGPEHVAEWVKSIIAATCEFYKKSENEMWDDVRQGDAEYEEYVKNGG